jgi:tetratricopeptide (TPR) repeat protein
LKPRTWILIGALAAAAAFCSLAVIFVVAHSTPAIQHDPMLFTSSGYPSRIDVEGKVIRISYQWNRTSLLIPDVSAEVLETLRAAKDAGEPVTFRAQLAGAHFDPRSGFPVFWVRSLSYHDKEFGPYEVEVPWSWRVLLDEQVALLKGIGYHNEQDYLPALAEFDRGLRTGMLKPAQRGLALALRAEACEQLAHAQRMTSARDYLLVRASDDYAEAAKFRHEDSRLLISRAGVLVQLGAYDDALGLLGQVLKHPGESHFQAGVMAAQVSRQRGAYAESLRFLDEVAARDEADLAMMYFYHRGWTLLLLERNPEAAAAFSDGLKSQRSWPWVYIGRACARHRMGDDDAALADLRTAVQLADRRTAQDDQTVKALRAELRNNIAGLERNGPPGSARVSVCDNFQADFNQTLRERSKLLDALPPAA